MSRYVVRVKDWPKGFLTESHTEYIDVLVCKSVDCAACRRKQLELQEVMAKNHFVSAVWKDTEQGIVLRIYRKFHPSISSLDLIKLAVKPYDVTLVY